MAGSCKGPGLHARARAVRDPGAPGSALWGENSRREGGPGAGHLTRGCTWQFQDIRRFVELDTSSWPAVTISDAATAAGNTVCDPARLAQRGRTGPAAVRLSTAHTRLSLGRAPPGTTARTSAAALEAPPLTAAAWACTVRGALPRPTRCPCAPAQPAPSARAKSHGWRPKPHRQGLCCAVRHSSKPAFLRFKYKAQK